MTVGSGGTIGSSVSAVLETPAIPQLKERDKPDAEITEQRLFRAAVRGVFVDPCRLRVRNMCERGYVTLFLDVKSGAHIGLRNI